MTTETRTTTWMCDEGHHGSSERHTYAQHGFTFRGYCSGMAMIDLVARTEVECDCECHIA